MREVSSPDVPLGHSPSGLLAKDALGEEALLVVGTDLGFETWTIGAALHYLEVMVKLDGVTHRMEPEDRPGRLETK